MRSYRLLIVDNDTVNRRLYHSLQKQMESGTCHIRQVLNGVAGLAELRAGTFHCVLLDFNLTDMTCFDFLTAASMGNQLPCAVVLLTGQNDEAIATEATKRGVRGYLAKDQASTTNLWRVMTQAVMETEVEQRLASLSRNRAAANIAFDHAAEVGSLMEEQTNHTVNPNRRSDLWFELPLSIFSSSKQSKSVTYVPSSPGRRVLVVDDLVMNRSVIGAFLGNAGHTVTEAEGGEEAVWLASEHPFDVILMDVRMPQVDGLEATRRIRALSGPHGQVPILALTAHTFADQKAKCQEAGMDGHLAKPIDYNTLIRAVDNVVATLASRAGD